MEDYQRQREEFWERYQEEFRRVRREHPGFWRELRELGNRHHDAQYTTQGARVCGWPEGREVATQTDGVGRPGGRGVRDAGTQTSHPRSPPGGVERAVQTDPVLGVGPALERWLEAHRTPATTARDPRPPRGGCWNCDSPRHRYSDCHQPKYRLFCYVCGEPGVTVKECERCGEEWRRAGPCRREQGRDRRRQ